MSEKKTDKMSEQERNEAIAVEVFGWKWRVRCPHTNAHRDAEPGESPGISAVWHDGQYECSPPKFDTPNGAFKVKAELSSQGWQVKVLNHRDGLCEVELWNPDLDVLIRERPSEDEITAILTAALKAIRSTA